MTITETCERVLELDAKATKGPIEVWEIQNGNGFKQWRLRAPTYRQMAFVQSSREDADALAYYVTAAPLLAVLRLSRLVDIAKAALSELAEGVGGAFSRDQLQHADNCIEAAKARAAVAFTQLNQA